MAHLPEVGNPEKEAEEPGLASPASPPANGPKALQLVGGIPVGLLALAGLDHGGDGGLVAGGDGAA